MRLLAALPAMAVCACATTGTPATQPGRPYSAVGFEPTWSLTIADGTLVFHGLDGRALERALPRRRPATNGYRYVLPDVTVEISHRPCEDEASRTYADTVRITASGTTVTGCGGNELPPDTLANTDWHIVAIDGEPVSGDTYRLSFDEDRLSGEAGCNRFSGPYREAGDMLVPGPIASTRMACPAARMEHERRALQVLNGPVRITFPAGDTLVMTGSGGTIRLLRS